MVVVELVYWTSGLGNVSARDDGRWSLACEAVVSRSL